MPTFEYSLIFSRVLKVFDDPLGELNNKRGEQLSSSISKKALNNTFIVKFLGAHIFEGWGKILQVGQKFTRWVKTFRATSETVRYVRSNF